MVSDHLAPGLRTLALRYEFIRELGRGGMATVYLARELASGRLVAIKAVDARHAEDGEALARFAREARTVAALDHPNIVRTYAVEQAGDEAVAIVMQHVPGGTLREILRRDGPFDFERAERVLRDVAEALRYAHARGLVHRDVKPENIFLEEGTGRALLSDFGIARAIEEDNRLTLTGTSIGTPTYMSPEQIDGRRLDGRTDIYSLGLVGWETLAGSRPWEGDSLYKVIYKQKHEELPRLTALRPGIPEHLLFAIEGALHKDRDTRWADVDEFLAELSERAAPAGAPGLASGDSAWQEEQERTNAAAQAAGASAPADGDRFPPLAAESASDRASGWPLDGALERGGSGDRWSPTVPPSPKARRTRRPATRIPFPVLLLVLGAVGVIGALHQRRTSPPRTPNTATAESDSVTRTASAGELALPTGGRSPVDTAPAGANGSAAGPTPTTSSSSAPASRPASARSTTTPSRPRATADARTRPAGGFARTHADSLALCRSPALRAQRACLSATLADHDRGLNNIYRTLIAEMRKQARVSPGAPDPPSVARLRAQQRAWLEQRDAECRRRARDEGPLWAVPRARCLGELGTRRAAVFADALTRLRAP